MRDPDPPNARNIAIDTSPTASMTMISARRCASMYLAETATEPFTNAWHGTSGGIRTFYEALLAGAEYHRRHLALVVPGPKTACHRLGEFARIYSIRAPHSPVFDRRYRVLLPHRYVGASRSAVWRVASSRRSASSLA